MATIDRFEVSNFKGIGHAEIVVEGGKPEGRFITLIGLNESGKTTVLEALSHSILADPDTSTFIETVQGSPEFNDLIPKKDKASFTGKITIKADLSLSFIDIEKIRKYILNEFNYVTVAPISPRLELTRIYEFRDSTHIYTHNLWTFRARVRKRTGHKIYDFSSFGTRAEWVQTVGFIGKLLPQVIYFPTFLIDFPARIYLEGDHGQVDRYYRSVINDILCSLNTPLSIQRHILTRAQKHRKPGKPFSSLLRSSPEGQQIDATVQELARELNRVIFGAWAEIFGKKISGKRINVEWHVDERKGRYIYLEIYIVDEDHLRFFVAERSLGFRWFFSFLLFTQFQSSRVDREKAIFLFDEPASHLHARAQERLLQSFEKISDPNHVIIYSTHSHYLINPVWLEKAYIVSNRAADPDNDDPDRELSDSRTLITLDKYRSFVSENPSKTTYFQPALDALDYSAPALGVSGPAVLVEGKFDYYPLKFFSEAFEEEDLLRIYPTGGAGTMGSLISLLRGWSVRFIILLDDDDTGKKEKARYKKNYMLDESEVVTIGELLPSLAGKEFEGIFGKDVRNLFSVHGLEVSEKPTKQDYHLLFHFLRSKSIVPELKFTKGRFRRLLKALRTHLS